jgi:hypothetical protein
VQRWPSATDGKTEWVRCGAVLELESDLELSFLGCWLRNRKRCKEARQPRSAACLQRRLAAQMFYPLRVFKFTLLRTEAAEWSAVTRL